MLVFPLIFDGAVIVEASVQDFCRFLLGNLKRTHEKYYELSCDILEIKSIAQLFDLFRPQADGDITNVLLMPFGSRHVGCIDNGPHGVDGNWALYAAQCGRFRACLVRASIAKVKSHGDGLNARYYPGTQLWIQDRNGKTIREIDCVNDGGRWTFESRGDVLPFEEVERYSNKIKKTRLDRELLLKYLSRMHIRVPTFDELVQSDSESRIIRLKRRF